MLEFQKVYGWYRCSRCKKIYSEDMVRNNFNTCQYQPMFLYCPNCGELTNWVELCAEGVEGFANV